MPKFVKRVGKRHCGRKGGQGPCTTSQLFKMITRPGRIRIGIRKQRQQSGFILGHAGGAAGCDCHDAERHPCQLREEAAQKHKRLVIGQAELPHHGVRGVRISEPVNGNPADHEKDKAIHPCLRGRDGQQWRAVWKAGHARLSDEGRPNIDTNDNY